MQSINNLLVIPGKKFRIHLFDGSFLFKMIYSLFQTQKNSEGRTTAFMGHVVRHHMEITIFILNNPQLSERHVETEELIKLLAKEIKLEDT